jgi:hypothetical protein
MYIPLGRISSPPNAQYEEILVVRILFGIDLTADVELNEVDEDFYSSS